MSEINKENSKTEELEKFNDIKSLLKEINFQKGIEREREREREIACFATETLIIAKEFVPFVLMNEDPN